MNRLEIGAWSIVIFILFALCLVGCDKDDDNKARPGHINMGYTFNIPKCSDPVRRSDGIHYVTRGLKSGESMSGWMNIEYSIIGDGVLIPTEGVDPRLALYFQRQNDDWSAEGVTASYRWFTKARPPLTYGDSSFSTPLEYKYWTPVVSSEYNTESVFNNARTQAIRVGFTLGGSSGAGHGVCVKTGNAKFVVRKFEIMPRIVE